MIKESNDSIKGDVNTYEFYQNGLLKLQTFPYSKKNIKPVYLDSNHSGEYGYFHTRSIYDDEGQLILAAQTSEGGSDRWIRITRYFQDSFSDTVTLMIYDEFTGAPVFQYEYRPVANDTIDISSSEFKVISVGGDIMHSCKNFEVNGYDSLVCADTSCQVLECGIDYTYKVTSKEVHKSIGAYWISLKEKRSIHVKVAFDHKGRPVESYEIRKNQKGIRRSRYKIEIEYFE